jgi:hypothetical protein
VHGLLARPALAVERGAGHRLGPARGQHRVPAHVPGLLANLGDRAPDDILHVGRIEATPVGQRTQDVRREIDRVDPGEAAVPLADRGPNRSYDHRVSHDVDGTSCLS